MKDAIQVALTISEECYKANGVCSSFAITRAAEIIALYALEQQRDAIRLMRCQIGLHNMFEPDNCNCVFCKEDKRYTQEITRVSGGMRS